MKDLIIENDSNSLSIAGIAIKDHTGRIYQLPKPSRYHDVIEAMVKDGCTKPIMGAKRGFILSDGRFVTRITAKFVAEKAGQLLDNSSENLELSSENMW